MARNVNVTLNWEGLYGDATNITGRAGIYIVIAGKKTPDGKYRPSIYKLLDIGQSEEASQRLTSHEREACWERNKPESSTLLFKFAAMPSKDYDETDRRIVECCLRASHRPLLCGTECNEGYNRDDTIAIKNIGSYLPLNKYSCHIGNYMRR